MQLFSEGSLHQKKSTYYCLSPSPWDFQTLRRLWHNHSLWFHFIQASKNSKHVLKIALISNFIKQIATFKAETIFFSDFQAHRYAMVRLEFHPSANLSTNHNGGGQPILLSFAVIGWNIFRRAKFLLFHRMTVRHKTPEGNQMVST